MADIKSRFEGFEHGVSAKLHGVDITLILTPKETSIDDAREFTTRYLADRFRIRGVLRLAAVGECPQRWDLNPWPSSRGLMWCFALEVCHA